MIDLTNQRFGRLVAVEQLPGRKWKCLCDCGETCEVKQDRLRRKRPVKSCGCLRGKNSLPDGVAALNSLFAAYKAKAVKRGYVFELTIEQFQALTSARCWYCTVEPEQIRRAGDCPTTYLYNGLDRHDNSKGYVLDNTIPCCKVCNRAKSNMSFLDFARWVQRISNRFISLFP